MNNKTRLQGVLIGLFLALNILGLSNAVKTLTVSQNAPKMARSSVLGLYTNKGIETDLKTRYNANTGTNNFGLECQTQNSTRLIICHVKG